MSRSILFLTSGRRVPSSRFRVQAYLPRLREDGFRVRVAPCVPQKYASLPGARWPLAAAKLLSRLVSILRAPFHDLVFIERELLPRLTPFLERMTSALNPAVHFDFDDALQLRYADDSENNPVARVLRLARGITAGNEGLADYARRFNDRVAVVPTAIDTDRFTPADGGGDVPLVWTGTSSNLGAVEKLAPALRRVPGARLLVICDRPPGDLGIPVEFVRWSETTEVEALRRGRVGIMPLPDEPWSRGKCGFKLLQYMACGIPCAASPVGVNPGILDGGACGLLPEGEDAWVEALTRLLSDAELYGRLARDARERVKARYSTSAVYPLLRAALDASFSER